MNSSRALILAAVVLTAVATAVRGAEPELDGDDNNNELDASDNANPNSTTPVVLRVGLYPWIPAASPGDPTFSVLLGWVEAQFEAANPGIDLQLMPMQDPAYDFYDLPSLVRWLTTNPRTSTDGWDIVEIDYSFYGKLIAANALAPISGGHAQWNLPGMFPVAREFYNVKPGYTVPHWLCSEFVFSRSAAIQNAPNAAAFSNALKNAVNPTAPAGAKNSLPVIYDLYGSWATPTFYLLGVQESFGRSAVEHAISTPLPPVSNAVAQGSTKRIVQACTPRGADPNDFDANPCWNGDYYNSYPRDLADRIASGEAVAGMGYSETMHDVMQSDLLVDKHQLRIRTVPNGLFGNPDPPLAFADGYVLNKFCTGNSCQSAAKKFIQFMQRDSTFRYIMTGADTQAPYRRVNRYLSAAMRTPYRYVRDDPLYTAVGESYESARTWPHSSNLIDNRLALYAAVRANVDPTAAPTTRMPDPHARKFYARP